MDYLVNEQTLKDMASAVAKAIDPYQIILFGSYSNGTQKPDSDIDLIIVEQESFGLNRSRRREAAKVWQALLPFNVSKDVLVYSIDEINRFKTNPLHVAGQALKYGRVIYEKGK